MYIGCLTRNCYQLLSIVIAVSAVMWLVALIYPQSMQALANFGEELYDCNADLEPEEFLCPPHRQSFRQQVGIPSSATMMTPIPTGSPVPVYTPAPALEREGPPTLNGKSLVVDQTMQVLRVYEDGVEVRTIPISTGIRMSYTPPFMGYVGHYVKTMYGFGSLVDHAWYLTKATGNIYIHSAPYTEAEGQKIYGGLEFLGVKPSSHGCIRLHPADAEWLFNWGPEGIPIRVTPPDFVKFKD